MRAGKRNKRQSGQRKKRKSTREIDRRQIISQAEPYSKLKHITPLQIVKINELNSKIKNHVDNINYPVSTAVSLIIFPIIMKSFIMDPSSPFHFFFKDYYDTQFQARLLEARDMLSEGVSGFGAYHQEVENLENEIKKAGQLLGSFLRGGEAVTVEETLRYLDSNPASIGDLILANFPVNDPTNTLQMLSKLSNDPMTNIKIEQVPQEVIDNLKEFFLKFISSYLGSSPSHTTSLVDLYKLIKTTKISAKLLQSGLKKAEEPLAAILIRLDFRNYIILSKVFFMMLGQWFIVKPSLNRLFPYGIPNAIRRKKPRELTTRLECLSYKEAEEYLWSLQETEKDLARWARSAVRFSRWSIPILLLLCFFYQDEKLAPFFFCVLLSACGCGATGALSELGNWYQDRTLSNNLNASEKLWSELFKEYLEKLTLSQQNSLKSSMLQFKFKPYRSQSYELPAKKVCRIVLNILLKNKIDIEFISGSLLFVSAACKPTSNQIKSIQEAVQQSLDSALKLKMLHEETKQVLENFKNLKCVSINYWPELQERTLKVLHVELTVPTQFINDFESLLLNHKPRIILKNDRTKIYLKIDETLIQNGTNLVFNAGNLQKLIKTLEKYDKKNPDINTYSASSASQSTVKPRKPRNEPAEVISAKDKGKEKVEDEQEPETYCLTWKAGHYDPKSKNNQIRSMENSKYRYTIFSLKPTDFLNDQQFDKFNDIVTIKPKIVKARFMQGIVRCNRWVRGIDGQWFIAQWKAKALGHHGDVRVYAESQKEITGRNEELLNFKAIEFNH